MKLCLVIAAEKDVRESARRVVKKMGHCCVETDGGQFAYSASQALIPDLFIVDLDDGVPEGKELISKLRSIKCSERPAILCCMNKEDRGAVDEALDAGADGYVLKPFDFDALSVKLPAWEARVQPSSTIN